MQFVFFLIFIIAVLTCGSIKVGPLSLRIYMTLIMMAYLLFTRRPQSEKPYKIRTDYIYLYLLCIGTLGLSLAINGGLIVFGYFERCLAYYLICIVGYFAVDRCVRGYKHVKVFVFVISLIILLDSIVTILQYQNDPIGWGIGAIFSDMDEFAYYLDDHISFDNVSKLPGIIGRPVTNGFFLAVTTPMLLSSLGTQYTVKSKFIYFIRFIFYVSTIAISLVAMFFLQQRAAFFLVLLVIAYHLLRHIVKKPVKYLIPLIVLLIIAIVVSYPSLGDPDTSRLSSTDNSSRTSLMGWAITVIFDNPLFGNIVLYNQHTDYSAHNVLIDSLIDSGIFGFIPLLYLFVKTIVDSLRIMLKSNDNYARVFSYSVLICMGMGMFHNTSYLTGDVIIFLSLALMFKTQVFSDQHHF